MPDSNKLNAISDIIVPIITACIGVVGGFFAGIKVRKDSLVKQEEKEAAIKINKFKNDIIPYMGTARNDGTRKVRTIDWINELYRNNPDNTYIVDVTLFAPFSNALFYRIKKKVKIDYELIHKFYNTNMKNGMESGVKVKDLIVLINNLNLMQHIELYDHPNRSS